MDWTVDPNAERPPSRQLLETVLDGLAAGDLVVGDQLPSVRGLASEVLVSHNTVARAWRDLEHLGVAEGRNGLGVFITEEGPAIARKERLGATLFAYSQAAREALRAGHDPEELARILQELERKKSA